MRFFLEFVSCCGSATLRSTDSSHPLQEEEEDEWSLVPPTSRTLRRNKRGRVGRLPAAPDWKPSLGPISENNAVPQRERGDPRNARDVKRRSTAAAAKVHHRNYSDDYDYRRAAMPTIMPAFSPTPFMF